MDVGGRRLDPEGTESLDQAEGRPGERGPAGLYNWRRRLWATQTNVKTKPRNELESEMKERDEARALDDRAEREDLNQGMDTGTHDSIHRGVNWAPEFSIRPRTNKPNEEPKK